MSALLNTEASSGSINTLSLRSSSLTSHITKQTPKSFAEALSQRGQQVAAALDWPDTVESLVSVHNGYGSLEFGKQSTETKGILWNPLTNMVGGKRSTRRNPLIIPPSRVGPPPPKPSQQRSVKFGASPNCTVTVKEVEFVATEPPMWVKDGDKHDKAVDQEKLDKRNSKLSQQERQQEHDVVGCVIPPSCTHSSSAD